MCFSVFCDFNYFLVMDSSTTGARIRRKSLFDFWRSTPPKGRLNQVLMFVKSRFPNSVLPQGQEEVLKRFLKKECEKIRLKWLRKQRRLDLFLKSNEQWLNEEMTLNMFQEPSPKPVFSVGRPKRSFENSSKKTKQRKIQHLLQEYNAEQLSFAAQYSMRVSGKRDAASLIQEVSTASPRRATGYKQARRRVNTKNEQRPYTAEEALALFISNGFTVETYKNIQQESKERGFRLYPCYDQVAKVKKQSYPPVEKFTLTDTHAEVELQALLSHTASRICKNILGEALRPHENGSNYTLIYKWGCDGSSGHSLYKQSFENSNDTDEYMFVVSLVPLRLVRNTDDDSKKIIWENPRPSSPRFCRIIKFLYKKETESLIKQECEAVEQQIRDLVPTVLQISGTNVSVKHEMILSMIDGKVCNVLSENKSTQTCFICKATSKEMNSTITREPNETMYQFGMSSLHAYIRTMECLLNITYRMEICQWQVRGDKNKEIFKKKKEEIKKKFKEHGLIIDKVKPGFGTSNDGNTARTFFHEYKETARITGLDMNLLSRLGTILAAIASGYEINPVQFDIYCSETRDLYLSLYPWYNMPATVHKMLVHGAEIIRHSLIPIGQMSEEASEAKNKEIRKVRLGHTLKTSRVRTNFDLIKYLLVSSDPYISLLRKLPKKNLKHYFDLKSLLKSD